jgi:hypothetical protein
MAEKYRLAERYRTRIITTPIRWIQDRKEIEQDKKVSMLTGMLSEIVKRYGDDFSIKVSFTYDKVGDDDVMNMEAIVASE